MSKPKAIEEKGPSAPAYLVTFSALATLLMLFFVLLLTLAKEQDAGMIDKGRYARTQAAFLQSISNFGLGQLFAKKPTPDFGYVKPKYSIANPDKQFEGRTINAEEIRVRQIFREIKVRQIFKKISQSIKSTPSQLVAQKTNFSATNINFSPGQAILDESAKKFLTQFALDLQQDTGFQEGEVKLYVLGLANDEQTEQKQWILSAMRAQAVADFLSNILARRVYSWGAGPGGYWVTNDGPVSGPSQILIAVLRGND